MPTSYWYDVPQALFSTHVVEYICAHSRHRPTLVLSANAAHARWLTQHPRVRAHPHLEIRTLQSALIGQLHRHRRRRVLSATARGALVLAAWQQSAGTLYQHYSSYRGAVAELSNALSWISQQRRHWRDVPADLAMNHELAQLYQRYCHLLDTYDVVGYDDVALHVSDLGIHRQHDLVIACELHHATPAQLHALSLWVTPQSDDILAAWVDPNTVVPELQVVHNFLCQYNTPHPWPTPPHTAYAVSQRVLGIQTHTAPITFIGDAGNHDDTPPMQRAVGAHTVIDECQSIARITYERLCAGRSVDIVCADDTLLPHVRTALALFGIALSPLKPATYQNPLIRMARSMIRWHATTQHDERDTIIADDMQLPFMVTLGTEQRATMHAQLHHEYTTGDLMQALAPQLTQRMSMRHALAWVWAPSHIPVDIGDAWLRDYHAWLGRIREIDQLVIHGDYTHGQRVQLYNSVDALSTPTEELYRSTLPLHFHTRGAAGASDCVIVMGLSEHIAPRPSFGYQLFHEDELCALFHASNRPLAPALTEGPAWREREARRMAQLVGTHAHELILTFAQHAVNGQQQLPSPYFERIAYDYAKFGRNGELIVDSTQTTIITCDVRPTQRPKVTPTPISIPLMHSTQSSPTQISSYLRCPRRYFYEKVLRLGVSDEDLDERSRDMGSLIHEVLCAATGNGQTHSVDLRRELPHATQERWEDMPARVMQVAQAAWDGTPCQLRNGDIYTPTQAWCHRFGHGLRQYSSKRKLDAMCGRWLKSEPCITDWTHRRPILLEQQLNFTLGETIIHGRIDRIDAIYDPVRNTNYYHIIDYKSGSDKDYLEIKRQFLPEGENAASNYQIPIYLYGTQLDAWSLTPAAVAMSLIFLQSKNEHAVVRTTTLSDGDSMILRNGRTPIGIQLNNAQLHHMMHHDIVSILQQMQHYPYPTQPSRSCAYCPFTLICDDSAV